MPHCFPINKTKFMQDVIIEESPGSMDDPKRVLLVMDALKEFSVDLLEWVLKNFTFRDCCTITILGVMPWLNIPLSSKTWSDIWSLNLEDLSTFQEKNEFKNDPKYQKVQRLIELCQNYGVVPEIRTEMGHPLRLLVVEQISSMHATLVVFDRHHDRKYIEFYAEKIPCNMVVMNDNGEFDLIKKRKCCDSEEVDNTPVVDSPASTIAPCSKSIISEHLKKCLKPKSRGKQHDKDFN
ncbi:hypothetical protein BUALT_Bualt10G0013800 [Buddleja alternifolia]|uniref:Uncharacterized protein n=1 Tax=Buddleja alternifolia TaxID=168488 RepID=A0AAV6X391_9LAMI|nr:hypothetical protein BUALT_Bualt10G0013800 [Buddleja alternifolia]